MKTTVGFVCGIVGMVIAVVIFAVGVICGFGLGISDKVRVNKVNKEA